MTKTELLTRMIAIALCAAFVAYTVLAMTDVPAYVAVPAR